MQDPDLLEATASEPLSMEEEIKMQCEWRDDEKKWYVMMCLGIIFLCIAIKLISCFSTFIILARDLIDSSDLGSIPPPPCNKDEVSDNEKKILIYPTLIENTLNAMIGDINLFLSEEEVDDDSNNNDLSNTDIQQQEQTDQSNELLTQAELDIMIAETSHRHKNLGVELVLTMMHYGASHLGIKRFFVKIDEKNQSSLRLFKEKLGYVEYAYVACFNQYELEVRCKSSSQMVELIERRWKDRDLSGKTEENIASDRLYDVFKCPLESS
jgi:RimJ/RimL family protein N-acetyltransferase